MHHHSGHTTVTTGTRAPDVIAFDGGSHAVSGWAGDDYLEVLNGEGMVGLWGNAGNDTLVASIPDDGQVHMGGGDGDDLLILDLTNTSGHHGHHAYGGSGADRFEFRNIADVHAPVLGRIDDFDPGRDTLWLDGVELDLNNLPSGVRIVQYLGQQWLSIHDRAIYALEGARGGGKEQHFSPLPAHGIESLKAVDYFDPGNFVPQDDIDRISGLRQISRPADVNRFVATDGNDLIADYILHARTEDGRLIKRADSTILAGDGDDVVDAGKGRDVLFGQAGNDALAGGVDGDRLHGGRGNDRLYGGSEADLLLGGSGDDRLSGGTGDDRLRGGFGSDVLDGGAGRDVLFGNGDADELSGGDARDRLFGGTGDDLLRGDDGDDTLKGGAGDDVVVGGAGADSARGGRGADVFEFSDGDMVRWGDTSGLRSERLERLDLIRSFEVGRDSIRFAGHDDVSGLEDLSAWSVRIAGDTFFAVEVNATGERILVDVAGGASLGAFFTPDTFEFVM